MLRVVRNSPTPAPLLSSAEACARIGIGRSTLTYWLLTKRITPAQALTTAGGRTTQYLFDPAEVERAAYTHRTA